MTAQLFTLHKPKIGPRYIHVVVGNGVDMPIIYQARQLIKTSKLEEGAGYNNYSYITTSGHILFVRKYYGIFGWKKVDHPDIWATLPIAALVKASARGRVMQAIMGSPYCVLYGRMRHMFPADRENQLRCAALCRLTLKQLGLYT